MSRRATFWFPERLQLAISDNSRENNITISHYVSQGVFLLLVCEEYDIFPTSSVIKNRDGIEVPLPVPYQDMDLDNPVRVCFAFNQGSLDAQNSLMDRSGLDRSKLLRHAAIFRNSVHELVGQTFPFQIEDKDSGSSLAIVV